MTAVHLIALSCAERVVRASLAKGKGGKSVSAAIQSGRHALQALRDRGLDADAAPSVARLDAELLDMAPLYVGGPVKPGQRRTALQNLNCIKLDLAEEVVRRRELTTRTRPIKVVRIGDPESDSDRALQARVRHTTSEAILRASWFLTREALERAILRTSANAPDSRAYHRGLVCIEEQMQSLDLEPGLDLS